jgi:hypothetical protein
MGRFNSSFDSHFNFVKVFFVIIGLVVVGSLSFRGCLVYNNMSEGKPTYIVKVPDYDGGYNSYMTNSYTEKKGCIIFKDEFGFEQHICDKYTVEKWK